MSNNKKLQKKLEEIFPGAGLEVSVMGLLNAQEVDALIAFPYDLQTQDGNITYVFYARTTVNTDLEGNEADTHEVNKDFWGIQFDKEKCWNLFLHGTNPLIHSKRMLLMHCLTWENPPLLYNTELKVMEYNPEFVSEKEPKLREEFRKEENETDR